MVKRMMPFLLGMLFAMGPALSASPQGRIAKEGVVVEFYVSPTSGHPDIREGDYVDIAFKITDEEGNPLSGVYPAVWVDVVETEKGSRVKELGCRQRVGMYLRGLLGIRPLMDLNSYFILVMNLDPTISVIDPILGLSGITQLYAMIILKEAGEDWAKTYDEKRMFVTLPKGGEIAVVDLERFKASQYIPVGGLPVRIGIQPDEQYLWIGDDDRGQVIAVDVRSLKPIAYIPTGMGHHELAFSHDSRYVFVSNRQGGTVSVIDTHLLKKVKDIPVALPISLAYSPLSRMLYIADGKAGRIAVFDTQGLEVIGDIEAKPGLGPMAFTPDGRWGVIVNSLEDEAYVIDASSNQIAHTLRVGDQPFQVAFTQAYAYIYALGTEKVSMAPIKSFGKKGEVPIKTFPAGQNPPNKASGIKLAKPIVPVPNEAAVLVVNPADNTVYYYKEGMVAPMGGFRNYGHRPRAVNVADRSLKESKPGYYTARIKIPVAGTYEVAFLTETPSILHCFSFTAKPNPSVRPRSKLKLDYLVKDKRVEVQKPFKLRFRLVDPETGQPKAGLQDVRVLFYRSPGKDREEIMAKPLGEGLYEVTLRFSKPGAYYVYVSLPSEGISYNDLSYLTLLAVEEKP
ncbi:MAG: cytochrome D1 [Gammaproteobacteria bacterium]|nr:MAG: cytochrome D1 [Gammaproteobacteria bacterium]